MSEHSADEAWRVDHDQEIELGRHSCTSDCPGVTPPEESVSQYQDDQGNWRQK